MKILSSTISDILAFVRRQDLLPSVNGGVGGLPFSRYGLLDLASTYRFWIFSHGCREESPHDIRPGCYVLDNGDSYSWLPTDVDHVVRFLFLGISPMLIDYFNGCAHAQNLDIVA
jgi:hypothetical protein